MTDEEIIKKILEIKLKEGLNVRELCLVFNTSMRCLNDILNKNREIMDHRRRTFGMIFDLYNEGKIDIERILARKDK